MKIPCVFITNETVKLVGSGGMKTVQKESEIIIETSDVSYAYAANDCYIVGIGQREFRLINKEGYFSMLFNALRDEAKPLKVENFKNKRLNDGECEVVESEPTNDRLRSPFGED